jgi:hypothetical protein
MIELTAALKRSITEDWNSLFLELGVYQPMWLGRRVGPFFQGICLERNSGNASYLPTSHIRCLCGDFPVVSLALGQPLSSATSGTQERISVQFHQAHFDDAARRVRAASLLPLSDSWGLVDLVTAIETYRELGRPDSKYPVFLFEDVVMAATWLGELDRAESAIAEYQEATAHWPENVMARFGGSVAWASKLRQLISNPKGIRDMVDANAKKLKAQHLPQAEMLA